MNIRRFVKKSIDNQKKLFLLFLFIAIGTGLAAAAVQILWGDLFDTYVYRDELYIELTPGVSPIININTAGMPVDIEVWDGVQIKLECVAELPLIIEGAEEEADGKEFTISQDDGFAVSIFTIDIFRYKLKVFLPRGVEYKEVNIITAGGNIALNGRYLKAGRVYAETKNAEINVVRPDTVYVLNSQSGNIHMNFDIFVEAVVIETVSGNIKLRIPDYTPVRLNFKTEFGSLVSDLEERLYSEQGVVLDVGTVSGDLVIEGKDTSLPENYPLL